MARTKKTARRQGSGPGVASKATKGITKVPRKGKPIHAEDRKRQRVNQKRACLSEIRKAQKITEICIPKASFRRCVRIVSEQLCSNLKWYSTGLDCLQCAAEDYLMEWFVDTMMLAAHAHRVTILARDMNSLSFLRFRFDKMIHPVDFIDKQMRDILLIPPARKTNQEIRIEEVTQGDIHAKTTRANEMKKERLYEQEHKLQQIEVKDKATTKEVLEEVDRRQNLVNINIKFLRPDVRVITKEEEHVNTLGLRVEDIQVFTSARKEVTDSVLFAALR